MAHCEEVDKAAVDLTRDLADLRSLNSSQNVEKASGHSIKLDRKAIRRFRNPQSTEIQEILPKTQQPDHSNWVDFPLKIIKVEHLWPPDHRQEELEKAKSDYEKVEGVGISKFYNRIPVSIEIPRIPTRLVSPTAQQLDHRQEELEKAKSDYEKLNGISKSQTKAIRYFEKITLKLVTSYLLFLSVIFVYIIHNQSNLCKYRWIPPCLLCLIFIIFAIPFKWYVRNWERTKYHYEINSLHRDSLHHKIVNLSSVDNNMSQEILKSDTATVYQRKALICLVSLALLACTIVILTASLTTSC